MRALHTQLLLDSYKVATGAYSVGLSLGGRPVAASDPASADFDAWQFVCGQGPSLDAQRTGRSVVVCDTTTGVDQWTLLNEAHGTWPAAGLLAVPIGSGAAVGALTLHRQTAGALSPSQHETARTCADHAAAWLVASLDPMSPVDMGHFDLIGRATGIVMAQTGLESDDATAIIRAHAYSGHLELAAVLDDIIGLRLTLV